MNELPGGWTARMIDALLGLYPEAFRRRYGREWREITAWRRAELADRRFGKMRWALRLALDTVRALPAAHMARVRSGSGSGSVGPLARGNAGRRGGPAGGDGLRHDTREVVRGLVRSPLFTVAALASIALGVGANTAIFSVVHAVLLRPLPYAGPDRLAIVWNEFPSSGMSRLPLSGVGVEELRAEPGTFEAVGGIWATTRTVGADERPVQVAAGVVTADFFSVLGVEPVLGRSWTDEPGGPPVPEGVVISHDLWLRAFGGDPAAVGSTARLDGAQVPILGVLPPRFRLHFPPDGSIPDALDVYVPLPWDLTFLPPDQHFLRVVARLRPGVDLEEARAGALRAADRAVGKYAELSATRDRFNVIPLQADAVRTAEPVLVAMLVGVGLFLLLAAANVGNLVMARATTRRGELAVRAVLGASSGRLARMVVLESVALAVVGGAVGVAGGVVGANLLWTLRPSGVARVDTLGFDPAVAGYAIGCCALAALVFGLAPVLSVRRTPPAGTLRATGSSRAAGGGARKVLTVIEVALGLVLVVGSALVGQTLWRLQQVDPGFHAEDVLAVKVPIQAQIFPSDAERARIATELERRLSGLPGVVAAGATSHLPLAVWANWAGPAPPDGTPEDERETYFADLRSVTPGYLDALGGTLISGRWLDSGDDGDSEPVVVIDRTMAARAFPDGDPVGAVLHPDRYVGGGFVPTPARVVGVVEDVRDVSLARPSAGQLFWPFSQSARWELTFVVRTDAQGSPARPEIEQAIRAVHGDLAPSTVAPLDDYVRSATAEARFVALLGAVFSGLALALAGLGLYGVVTFLAVQRVAEFGVRIALGARPATLVGSVVREGLQLGLYGIAAGLVLALGLAGFLDRLLYGVRAHDPLTLIGVGGVILGLTVLACLMPARRAARTDPMRVLRAS